MSLKRLGYVILIVLGICGLFLSYNFNESNRKANQTQNKVYQSRQLIEGKKVNKTEELKFYVIGDAKKELYRGIFKNVQQLMEDLNVLYTVEEKIETDHLPTEQSVLIFCDDSIGKHTDLKELGSFIRQGGKAVFAAGIAEGYEDAYLQPILGITEKTVKAVYEDFWFRDNFLPLQEENMSYGGFAASAWLNIRPEAQVYVKEKKQGVPIVYTYPYGKGESLVVNTTFLDNMECMGILTSGLGELLEDFIYPIIGTKSVFLDNFPMVTYINDKVCMNLYGRNTEAFVRDVIWPVFQGMAVRNNVKYTSSVLAVSTENAFPDINHSLFQLMGKSALKFDGELAYAAYIGKGDKLYRNEAMIENFNQNFPKYQITGLVMMQENPPEQAVAELQENVRTVRGSLNAEDREERMSMGNQWHVFPKATQGIDLADNSLLSIASVMSSYGFVSHVFDINELVTVDEKKRVWDFYKKELGTFEKEVLRKTDYLEPVTLSGSGDALNSYLNLEYTWKKEGDKIRIQGNHFRKGQPFYYRTNREIRKAEGAEYEKISDGWYLLRLEKKEAVIQLENEVED